MSIHSKSSTPIPNENNLTNTINYDQSNIHTKRTESRTSSQKLTRSQSYSSEFSDSSDRVDHKTPEPIRKSESPAVKSLKGSETPSNKGTPEPIRKSESPAVKSLKRSETPSNKGTPEPIRKSESPAVKNVPKSDTPSEKENKTISNIVIQRPPSPKTRHRTTERNDSRKNVKQRTRSNSPQKSFSYLSPDRFNIRLWKRQQRFIAKQQEDDRIYYENRQKLERLAKIAKEPSSYPSISIEQERLRQRHADDHHRKVLKSYIPILQENYCIVKRLAHVKGVYNLKQMDEEYKRHTQILAQDAANRKKAREIQAQRLFLLPKIKTKS